MRAQAGLCTLPPSGQPPRCQTSPTPGNTQRGCSSKFSTTWIPPWPKGPSAPRPAQGRSGKADRHMEGSTPCPRVPPDRHRQSQTETCPVCHVAECSAWGSGGICQPLPLSGSILTTVATAVPWGPAKALATGPDHLLVLRQNFQAEEGGFRQLDSTGIKK